MEWIDRLNSAIRYMEEHLTDEIDYEQLGRIACCSSWHFQRMFSYMAGIPLSEYIRRRKMSLAAVDLLSSDARIIDIAEKYGYRFQPGLPVHPRNCSVFGPARRDICTLFSADYL